MSLVEELEFEPQPEPAHLPSAYPDFDAYGGLFTPYAPMQMGPDAVLDAAADGWPYQMAENLTHCHPTHHLGLASWGLNAGYYHHPLWPPLPTMSPASEGTTFPALPIYEPEPRLNAVAPFTSSLALRPVPSLVPDNAIQSRNIGRHSTVGRRNRHNPQASASKIRRNRSLGAQQQSCDKNLTKSLLAPGTGEVAGFITRMGSRHTVPRKLSEAGRKQAEEVRKAGACDNCRRSKKKCKAFRDYEACESCIKSRVFVKLAGVNGPLIYRLPCFRSDITDAAFFRLGPSPESPHKSTRRKQIYATENVSPLFGGARLIELTQGIGDRNVTLSVSKFKPIEGDKTAYLWSAGQMPPFCISDVEDAKQKIGQYVRDSRGDYIRKILSSAHRIAKAHFGMAVKFAENKQNSLVGLALDLWSASRVIEEFWSICGDDTLDIEPIGNMTSPWYQKVPVTPIMDTQLDQFVIKEILIPLKIKILKRLQDQINKFSPEVWFELYLTVFVLLNSIEAAAAHQQRFAKIYGLPSRFANHKEIEEFFHGSRTLLGHFHFMCRGAIPIESLDWEDSKTIKFAQLDEKQAEFMVKIQLLVDEDKAQLLALRSKHKYHEFMYWCHQLFFSGWQAGSKQIEEEIP